MLVAIRTTINSYIETFVKAINGLSEFSRIRENECQAASCTRQTGSSALFFLRYDPHFEGDEPLSLQIGQAQPRGVLRFAQELLFQKTLRFCTDGS